VMDVGPMIDVFVCSQHCPTVVSHVPPITFLVLRLSMHLYSSTAYYRNLLPVANKLVGESRFRSDNDEKLQLLCAVDTQ
jgi:hypothetical protein